MAQWGTEAENAANSVSWVASSLSQGDGNAAQATQNTNLVQNTTPDAFIAGVELGQFAVDKNEMAAARAQGLPRPAAAGWTLRTEGKVGTGREGRVTFETLVAIKDTSAFITSDTGATADDDVVPDYAVVISTQPADVSVTGGAAADFTVVAITVPSGGTLAYAWEFSVDSGANWNPVSSATVNAATLSVLSGDPQYIAGLLFRCVVTVTDGGNVAGVTTDSAELVAIA